MTESLSKPSLIIFYQFDPWRSSIGGIQTFIRHFLKYAPDSFEIKFVGTGSLGEKLGKWQPREYDGVPVQYCPIVALENDDVRGLVPTTLRYTWALRQYKFNADFLHFYRIEPTIVTHRWKGHKTFFIQNDIEKQLNPKLSPNAILWQAFPQAYLKLEKLLIHQFDAIYSCNTNAAQFYQRRFPQLHDRINLLNNTVDTDVFFPVIDSQKDELRQALAQQLSLPIETQFILFAGRLHPQKDPLLLLRALAQIPDPKIHLLMAGEGELLEDILAEIKILQIESKVSLLGGVDQARLAELHRLSELFVLSSAYEGLPFAALEALASGIPVVTTDAGDTPKVLIPGSGLVCQERTPEAIANSLTHVLNHPAEFPRKTCIEAIATYTAKEVVNKVYEQMLTQWHRQGSAR